jgi:hypothetical protein
MQAVSRAKLQQPNSDQQDNSLTHTHFIKTLCMRHERNQRSEAKNGAGRARSEAGCKSQQRIRSPLACSYGQDTVSTDAQGDPMWEPNNSSRNTTWAQRLTSGRPNGDRSLVACSVREQHWTKQNRQRSPNQDRENVARAEHQDPTETGKTKNGRALLRKRKPRRPVGDRPEIRCGSLLKNHETGGSSLMKKKQIEFRNRTKTSDLVQKQSTQEKWKQKSVSIEIKRFTQNMKVTVLPPSFDY